MAISVVANRGDYILSFAVVVQSLLVIFQQCLIAILHMEPESTTIYRVVLSALPVIWALYYIWVRKKLLCINVYVATILILLIHVILFVDNAVYIKESASRFLLPILLPIFLSVACIRNFQILVDTMYYVSWGTFALAFIYALAFFMGQIKFESYNMSFSYGLLIPTLSLYTRKKIGSVMASFVMFLMIVALGSRGAAVIIACFLLYDLMINNKKFFLFFLLLIVGGYLLLPVFINFLDSMGIASRTLLLLLSGDIGQDSGRIDIYQQCMRELMQSSVLGLGLYGDRVMLNGSYCHNIFLEMMINFGIPLAFLLIIGLLIWLVVRYYRFMPMNRSFLVMIMLAALVKLLVSGSYLEDYDLAFLLGVLYRGDRDMR